MPAKRNFLVLAFALLIAIVAVSTAAIFIRFAQRDAPSLTIAALRLTFASLLLAPVALKRHRADFLNISRTEVVLVLLSGLFLAAHFATWISSLEYTSVASSVVFVSTGPLWVALLSPFYLGERLSRTALIGLGSALLGGVMIGMSGACVLAPRLACPSLVNVLRGRELWGNFLALAGAWSVSGYLILGRRLRQNISLIPYIFLVYSMAAIALLVVMLAAGETPFGYRPATYLWLVLLALVPQLIGHSTYNWALRFLPATFVAAMTLGEPIGSATLAYLILREKPTLAILLGGVFILVGIYFVSRNNPNGETANIRGTRNGWS